MASRSIDDNSYRRQGRFVGDCLKSGYACWSQWHDHVVNGCEKSEWLFDIASGMSRFHPNIFSLWKEYIDFQQTGSFQSLFQINLEDVESSELEESKQSLQVDPDVHQRSKTKLNLDTIHHFLDNEPSPKEKNNGIHKEKSTAVVPKTNSPGRPKKNALISLKVCMCINVDKKII